MKIDVSFLPVYAATFMLVFARIGTMVMLLPGFGELSVPVRVRLTVALVLTAVLLPLHRSAYNLDLRSFGPVVVMLAQEILIGAVLGLTVGFILGVVTTVALEDEGFLLSIPVASLIVFAILAVLAGVLAAIPPARRAARVDVLRAVTTE